MSEPGDVVWATGFAWQRDDDYVGDTEKQRWLAPGVPTGAGHKTLKELKEFQDFRWLVKNGEVKWTTSVLLPPVASPETLIEKAIVASSIPVGSHRLENSDEVIYNAHDPKFCEGSPCVIHNLTDHHMRSWPQHYREDSRLMERICTHGVGHPDPDLPDQGDKVHGCDGCCIESTAPTRGGYSPGYEAYQFQISNLFELLAQAEKERDTAEQRLATAHAEHEKSLTDWARAREERDQARRELADLQRLVAAAEANEPVLVHPDWRQAEIDALAEERDQLKEKVRMLTLVSRHETLVAEAYRLENIIKETSKERDELNEKLATEKSIREQLQRDLDYAERQYIELRRQFDVVVNDRNTLRARCDELERGDRHSCGVKCGRQEERRAVVAWLNKNPQGWARQWSLAGRIERGEHDV